MKIAQISVFLENKLGRLAQVTKTLAQADVNIRALFLADTIDFGILRLIVDQPQKAFSALSENDFRVSTTEVLAVEVPDKPGGLWEILNTLDENKVGVEYMYAFVGYCEKEAIMMFRFDDLDKGFEVLSSKGFSILSGEKIYKM